MVDKHIDSMMTRTQHRPVATGRILPKQVFLFAFFLSIFGLGILAYAVNYLTAFLTFFALLGYAVIYTGYLKRATPQNIVIGGLAGAIPPLLGWTAVTNTISPEGLILVLIIYIWTPPHFWALAIYRIDDYAKANIPMLPVTHGVKLTKLFIVLYTILLMIATTFPFLIGMSSFFYFIGSLLLGLRFLYWTLCLYHTTQSVVAMKTFRFSISYLLLLFIFLLIDHWFFI